MMDKSSKLAKEKGHNISSTIMDLASRGYSHILSIIETYYKAVYSKYAIISLCCFTPTASNCTLYFLVVG